MNNNTKFIVIVNKLNKMIADLNIEISNSSDNDELKERLEQILNDKEKLYEGNVEDLEKILLKYGEISNE